MPELDILVGDLVRFGHDDKAKSLHEVLPKYNPEPGAVGTVLDTNPKTGEALVQWADGETRDPGHWWTYADCLAFISREGATC